MSFLDVVWWLCTVYTVVFWLSKEKRKLETVKRVGSMRKSFWILAKELSITWGDDTKYWKWIDLDSSSSQVAEPLLVWWMDISGRIDTRMLEEKTSYGAFFVFKLKEFSSGLEKATASVRLVKEISEGSGDEGYTVFIDTKNGSADNGRFPHQRSDGWMEINLGDFFSNTGEDGVVEMRLFDKDNMNPKTGLLVRGIELRPY